MRIVNLTGTRMAVSRLGFGTASLHHLLTTDRRQRLLSHAHASGITYFDTAPLYGHGIAERELGRFLRGRRSELTVATKFGQLPGPLMSRFPLLLYSRMAARQIARRAGLPHGGNSSVARDFSVAAAIRSFDASLKRLAIDWVDVLYLHEPELSMIPDPLALVDTLARLRESGKVRYIGLSGYPEICAELISAHPRLAEIFQLDVAAIGDANSLVESSCTPPHVTFGHFRRETGAPRPVLQNGDVERSLSQAVKLNPSGVILFSSRKCEHIDAVAAALRRIDCEV